MSATKMRVKKENSREAKGNLKMTVSKKDVRMSAVYQLWRIISVDWNR